MYDMSKKRGNLISEGARNRDTPRRRYLRPESPGLWGGMRAIVVLSDGATLHSLPAERLDPSH